MRQKSIPVRDPAERVVKDIRRATRRHFTAEDKIRIVLEGLRGERSDNASIVEQEVDGLSVEFSCCRTDAGWISDIHR